MRAMLQMRKLDIDALTKAYQEEYLLYDTSLLVNVLGLDRKSYAFSSDKSTSGRVDFRALIFVFDQLIALNEWQIKT